MKIENKKTHRIYEVSKEEWEQMTSRGEHRKYKVLDASDEHFEISEIKVEPIELVPSKFDEEGNVTELSDEINDDIAEKPKEEVANDIEFYKNALDDMGVEYHWNTGLEKLKKLYEENI